ncbi:MAG: energy transducer TonB [Betaproteobacteria bacterium HGW-Betaproteobacteria-4]|jgi:protein TonB|nr:MAG: energy transducer TonB [Betaproteobacteria bacterium HGW-Betaproteobacteria-4]
MTDSPRHLPPERPEWRHSGRYLLLAAALHAAILFYPPSVAIDPLEAPPPGPITVSLQESVVAPPTIPPAAPEKPPAPKPPRHIKPAPPAPPILAMAAEQVAAPGAITVPAPVTPPGPPAPEAAPAPTRSVAPATVSAPLFNAAYLNNPEPKYPALSRRLGEEGKVLLRVRVRANGLAATVDIEKSSNFERLDEAARRSVAHWRFVPAKRGDEAIEATVIVPVVFHLDN